MWDPRGSPPHHLHREDYGLKKNISAIAMENRQIEEPYPGASLSRAPGQLGALHQVGWLLQTPELMDPILIGC